MQKMFPGFEDNEEYLSDTQKLRLLFQMVQAPNLAQVKRTLQVSYDLDAENKNVALIANSLVLEAYQI